MRKRLLIIVLVVGAIVVGSYLFIRLSLQKAIGKENETTGSIQPPLASAENAKAPVADLRPLFIKRMQQLLKSSSDGLYDLSVGDMKVDLLASTVSLQNVAVHPNAESLKSLQQNGRLPVNVFNISFKSLVIEGINLDDAINTRKMDYKLVKLVDPVINIYRRKQSNSKETADGFSKRFLGQMKSLDIKKIIVENGTIITHSNGKQETNRFNKVQVNMADVVLDSNTVNDKKRFLFAKAATLTFHDYTAPIKGGLYTFKIADATVKFPQEQIFLSRLSFDSPLSKEEFEKRQKFSNELYRLSLSSIKINKVNWWSLFNKEEVIANEVFINGGKLSVYLDRSLPPSAKMGNFPSQLLAKLHFKMNIGSLRVRNVNVSYEEYNPLSQQSGTIYFDKVTMDASGISNFKNKNTKPVVVNSTALFMHNIPVHVNFSFDRSGFQTGKFIATINSGEIDKQRINAFAMPLGMTKIKSGAIQKVEAKIKGDQWQASGNVLILYKDLNLSLLEKDKSEAGLNKKHITSFIANAFVLKKNNPRKEEALRKETAEFKRIPEGGFFMLVWKTILVGALKTIGAPVKLASKTAKSSTGQ